MRLTYEARVDDIFVFSNGTTVFAAEIDWTKHPELLKRLPVPARATIMLDGSVAGEAVFNSTRMPGTTNRHLTALETKDKVDAPRLRTGSCTLHCEMLDKS